MQRTTRLCLTLTWLITMMSSLLLPAPAAYAAGGAPALAVSQAVDLEPLLAGEIGYRVTITNTATRTGLDRGHNVTLVDTLPSGMSYVAADPTPTLIEPLSDGTTRVTWGNLTDLEARESIALSLTGRLSASLPFGTTLINRLDAQANTMPDNSGAWVQASGQISASPQAIDIEGRALPSSGVHQVSGAGEYPAAPGRQSGADWAYRYRLEVRNNNLSASDSVVAVAILPPGAAYLGAPTIAPNPNASAADPTLTLRPDGSLELRWSLGRLTTAQHTAPVLISFDAAIPYRYRTAADISASRGAYAGPMSGPVIAEEATVALGYEASALFAGIASRDGTISTPADDQPATLVSDYVSVEKSASPGTVGIGTAVTFTLRYSVSEYYSASDVVITDLLPDGMSYSEGSATLAPTEVLPDAPAAGRTTLIWRLPADQTTPGGQGTIQFRATVAPAYTQSPYPGAPVVSGDRITNSATIAALWADLLDAGRSGSSVPDRADVSVLTRMPTFTKQARDPATGAWVAATKGFTGDTRTFRLIFTAAADVDARGIIIRDFLPRGMSYVAGSAQHSATGSFTSAPDCTSAPTTPAVSMIGGLQMLEWRLCNVARGSVWEATIDGRLGDIPDIQPGWIVANFGNLAGQNSAQTPYSLRALATVDYAAPSLTLTKTASPGSNLVAGNRVTYTISVTNSGRAPAYNLVITDIVPPDLLIPASGGTSSPSGTTYTTQSGSPASGQGGVLRWVSASPLAVGATQTFQYYADIPAGLPAGAQMTNLASVAYNSRADSTGHQWPATSIVADPNTDDETVYLRGMRVTKSATPAIATIGDIVHWTLTVTLPAGQIGYWPVLEENDLPEGFDYVAGSTTVTGAVLDTAHHPVNPIDDGNRDLRWYFETIDNAASATAYTFTVAFDTLVTGVSGSNRAISYYPNNCCLATARNSAYIGWYDDATGYANLGYAYEGYLTSRIDRRSPRGGFDAQIRQPRMLLSTSADRSQLGAGERVTLVIQASNLGNSEAFDVALTNALPAGLTFVETQAMAIGTQSGLPAASRLLTDTNTAGSSALSYSAELLYVGETWTITMTAQVDPAISSALQMTNLARVAAYSSRPGIPADTNGDTLIDERSYSGPEHTLLFTTPVGEVDKQVETPAELTYGAPVTYTLTVPSTPMNAWMYDVQVQDLVDSRLLVEGVSGGSATGNAVSASFASIPPNEQRTITIQARLPQQSLARDGDILRNRASLSYTNGGARQSNEVASTVVAPALVVTKAADRATAVAGDIITYQVSVANVGSGVARALSIQDALPAGTHYLPGSTRTAQGVAADPVGGAWALPELAGRATYTMTYQVQVDQVAAAQALRNSLQVAGVDSRATAIPANNMARVPADTDPDDHALASVYGPLDWVEESSFVAFEDLKKFNWSDWDYNDFVVRITMRKGRLPDGSVAAIEIRYTALARGAGFLNHSFSHQLPVLGGGWYLVRERRPDGTTARQEWHSFSSDDPTALIYASTRQALPQPTGGEQTNTRPDQAGVVDGFGATLTMALNDPSQNLEADLPPLPWDPFMRVIETGQEVHIVQPGHLDNTQTVTAIYDRTAPTIGYDLPLAQVFPDGWRWPSEFVGLWRGYPMFVRYITTGGAQSRNWHAVSQQISALWGGQIPSRDLLALLSAGELEPTSRYFASPVAADLTGDGVAELIIGNMLSNQMEVYDGRHMPLPGWPQPVGGSIRAAAAVADVDGDGQPEVLVGAADGKLSIWRADGSLLPGWPVQLGVEAEVFRILATPAVGDIDGDGQADVIVPLSDGRLYAFDREGRPKAGWPTSIGLVRDSFGSQIANSSPQIADIDGDGSSEVLVGSTDGRLYAFRGDGSLRWFYASGDMVFGAPLVADLDPARAGLEVAFASGDRYVYLLDMAGARIWRRATGWTVRSSPVAADLDGDGDLEILVSADDDKLWAWHHGGARVEGWPQLTGADLFGAPAVGDIDADGAPEIVVGSDDGKVYAWEVNGAPVAGWPRAQASAVKGSPALANLDGDPDLEVAVADMGGYLTIYGGPAVVLLPLVVGP